MNRRSWFKSVLATVVLAISDGIPKILADDSKVKLTERQLINMINEASKEIWEIQRKATHWIIREPNES
jgi:hypothetical protein